MRTEDIVEAFAARLRGAKGEADMSDERAAQHIGRSRQYVGQIIADPGKARFGELLDLLEAYGADPSRVWSYAFEKARRVS